MSIAIILASVPVSAYLLLVMSHAFLLLRGDKGPERRHPLIEAAILAAYSLMAAFYVLEALVPDFFP